MVYNTKCPKLGGEQWTCKGDECRCHLRSVALRKEIDKLEDWIKENPTYIDGVIEAKRKLDVLYPKAQEAEMHAWNI